MIARSLRRYARVFVVVALAICWNSIASAQSAAQKAACVQAFDQAQDLMADRSLLKANDVLPACLESHCPAAVSGECAKLLEEVKQATPSVIPRVRNPSGGNVANVSVSIDGEALTTQLDGTAISVDPGARTFAFHVPGNPTITRKITVAEGEKRRIIEVTIGSNNAPGGDANKSNDVPASAWVLYAVGIAGFGGFIGLGVHSLSLEDACPCNESDLDDLVLTRALADVSLGVGAVATAIALGLTINAALGDDEPSVSVAVAPAPAGAVASLNLRW